MDGLRLLTERIGGWWTGVKFHFEADTSCKLAGQGMRFCEVVAESRTRQVILTRDLVDCPGARRSLGWPHKNDEALAGMMAEKEGISPDAARSLIFATPRLRTEPVAVTVGDCADPDVALSYVQPEVAMRFLRRWQGREAKPLIAEVSSVMAVCGSVVVRAYLTNRVCLSFGCPDSRKHGSIGRDRLVMGLPLSLAEEFL